jgi:hypothetical protein
MSFCGTFHQGTLPILDLYYQFKPGVWKPENHRLMVYHNQYLFEWHINRNVVRNEKISADQKRPVGYFTFHQQKWVLVNQRIDGLRDLTNNQEIPIGTMVELTHGQKLLLSKEEGGRVVLITIANQ